VTTRVFVVEDHDLIRSGLRYILDREEDLAYAGEATTLAEALIALPSARADVVLVDDQLPDGSGVRLLHQLRDLHPEVRSIFMTIAVEERPIRRALSAGAVGYFFKQTPDATIVDIILQVAAGKRMVGPDPPESPAGSLPSHALIPFGGEVDLTERDRVLLSLLARGLSNREIGERLSLTEKTVKNLVSRLLHKLGFRRRTQAALYAVELGREQEKRDGTSKPA
jgi:two-component system, NarL family, response regulator DevR